MITKNKIMLLQIVFLFVSFSLVFVFWLNNFNISFPIYPLCLLLSLQFIFQIWSWCNLQRKLFHPYILFLSAATFFNAGQAILEVFYLNEDGIFAGKLSDDLIMRSILLVIICLGALHLGAIAGFSNKIKSIKYKNPPKQVDVAVVGWFLFSVSVVPAVLSIKNAWSVGSSFGYSAIYDQEAVSGLSALPRALSQFFVPANMFLLAGSKKNKFCIALSFISIVIYGFMWFLLGFRGQAVLALLAYFWLWHRCILPLPKTLLIIGGLLLLVLLPLIKTIRNIPVIERFSIGSIWQLFISVHNPIISLIFELGDSMRTVAYTIQLVPSSRPFDYGASYLFAIFGVVPNLFWNLHPSAKSSLDSWITSIMDPYIYSRGGGYGFSFIAEAYLNFGWFGAPIVVAFIGFVFIRFILWADNDNEPAKLAMLASFLSFFLIFSRGESGAIIRSLLWYALLPYTLVYVTKVSYFKFKQ